MGASAIAPAPASISPRLAAAADDGSAPLYVSGAQKEASAWVAARLHGDDFAKEDGEKLGGKQKEKAPRKREGTENLDACGSAWRSLPIIS